MKFINRIREVERFKWIVSMLIILLCGVIVGLYLGCSGMLDFKYEKVKIIMNNKKVKTGKVEGMKSVTFKRGNAVSIFTADKGTMTGDDMYLFTNAKLIELYPGTMNIKSEMSADIAEIKLINGEMGSAQWRDNFKRREYSEEISAKLEETDQ